MEQSVDVDWEEEAHLLFKEVLKFYKSFNFHGHHACCGTYREEHKEDCTTFRAIKRFMSRLT